MNQKQVWEGFMATVVIVLVIGGYAFYEPFRMDQAQANLQAESIALSTDIYAQNCVICHGAAGEGIGAVPGLNNDGMRNADYRTLYDTIARGRYNTAMAGWSVDEGGILTNAQINQLVVLIREGDWNQVSMRVAELGLNPPTAVEVEVPQEMLTLIEGLPDGGYLSEGLLRYAETCAACHGANAEGSTLAPALNNPELRAQNTDEDLYRTIEQGVPGTLMAAWNKTLTPDEINALVMVVRRWDEIEAAGLELPTIEVPTGPPTPEMIAAGRQLFTITCVNCHGVYAQGTPMAPALNNKTLLSETPDQALYQIIAQGISGSMMPAWGGRLSEMDINSLVAYLRSLEPTAPILGEPNQ